MSQCFSLETNDGLSVMSGSSQLVYEVVVVFFPLPHSDDGKDQNENLLHRFQTDHLKITKEMSK